VFDFIEKLPKNFEANFNYSLSWLRTLNKADLFHIVNNIKIVARNILFADVTVKRDSIKLRTALRNAGYKLILKTHTTRSYRKVMTWSQLYREYLKGGEAFIFINETEVIIPKKVIKYLAENRGLPY
jgi:ribosomal protein L10